MKYFRTILLASLLMAFQCESEEPLDYDSLQTTGLLGRWEIRDEIINGNISDMTPKCCEFLEFLPDSDISDTKGLLSYTDAQGMVNNGTFQVDLENRTIGFVDQNNDSLLFDFSINETNNLLTLDFTENGTNRTQTWVKEN